MAGFDEHLNLYIEGTTQLFEYIDEDGTVHEEHETLGDIGQRLARLQIAAIIVEGKHEGSDYYLLKITNDGIEFINANKWSGKGLYQVYKDLYKEFGAKVSISSCGIAAEMLGTASGVCFNDPEGLPSRYAGRGGLGAVMASKGLKFVVVDDTGAPGVEIKNPEVFKQ
ncbi:unnamed protein product, partial [marine sediment metagenome]